MLDAIQIQPSHTTSVHALDALFYADLQCSSPVVSRDVSDIPWVHQLHSLGKSSHLPTIPCIAAKSPGSCPFTLEKLCNRAGWHQQTSYVEGAVISDAL